MKKILVLAAVLSGTAGAALAQTPGVAPMAPMAPHGPNGAMAAPQTRDSVVAKVREHFARADANRDGFVAADEMQAMRGQRQAKRMAMRGANAGQRANPGAMFDRLDANRDNMISREEFERGRSMRAERAGQRGQRMGMRGMRGHRMALRGQGGMLRRADADRDGRVSLAEAQAAALAHFDRLDLNHDGRITPEERQQMRQQRLQSRAPRAG